MSTVASRTGMSLDEISNYMWSDLEENLLIKEFYKVTPQELLCWYNVSLIQTLLFNCTRLEFHIQGGANWKRVLRAVKAYGLMYNLRQLQEIPSMSYNGDSQNSDNQSESKKEIGQNLSKNNTEDVKQKTSETSGLSCSIDGPISLFKLTDRYGTSIAKLLPSIISSEKWSIKAWIVRQTQSMGRKIYEFQLSNDYTSFLLGYSQLDFIKNSISSKEFNSSTSNSSISFDSKVEERFASRFNEASLKGWTLIREPDPLLLSNGRALIPDFVFEKLGKKIYLEIVGFWTKEYLHRKIEKILDAISESSGSKDRIDLIIAINESGYASSNSNSNERLAWRQISSLISPQSIVFYKNNTIPIKPIIDYLRSIDNSITKRIVDDNYTTVLTGLENIGPNNDPILRDETIISISEIADKHNIPVDAALKIINKSKEEKQANILKDRYIIAGLYLIPKVKADRLQQQLTDVTKFKDACNILSKNNVPEACCSELMHKMGYSIIWKNMDYNSATIAKTKET
jgi:predicted nuclease of restriction endonuclease-like RecB superfamily